MTRWPNPNHWADDDPDVGFLYTTASSVSRANPLHEVLKQVIEFATAIVKCDSCFVYVLEKDELVLRASKNPHPEIVDRLKLKVGQGITGWVAEHREPVAVELKAFEDPRFKLFNDLPEDHFEAFLSVPLVTRGHVVGVINLQNRRPHHYSGREMKLISTVGFLVGAEIEMARLQHENLQISTQLAAREMAERSKDVLHRDPKNEEEDVYLTLRREAGNNTKSAKKPHRAPPRAKLKPKK